MQYAQQLTADERAVTTGRCPDCHRERELLPAADGALVCDDCSWFRCADVVSAPVEPENYPLDASRKTLDARQRTASSVGGGEVGLATTRGEEKSGAAREADDEPGYRAQLEDLEAIGQLEAWDVQLDASRLPRHAPAHGKEPPPQSADCPALRTAWA